jgi:dsRNA-specific ribonuclease
VVHYYDAREGGPKVLAEVLEALLAAVFLDSGCDMVVPAALSVCVRGWCSSDAVGAAC